MTDTYKLESRAGVTLVRFTHFDKAGLAAHGITTRIGGVSEGPLSALNMGRRGWSSRNVCRRITGGQLQPWGFPRAPLCFPTRSMGSGSGG